MLMSLRRKAAAAAASEPVAGYAVAAETMKRLAHQAGSVGRGAAELHGLVGDLASEAAGKTESISAIGAEIERVLVTNRAISAASELGGASVAQAREAVARVSGGVAGVVDTLRQVAGAAHEISQIALQTRLVAFNASVEAKRAGEAGRGFAVVAEAVKDLAAKVEQSSKQIMSTVSQLDRRVGELAGEIAEDSSHDHSAFQRALAQIQRSVAGITQAAQVNQQACETVGEQMRDMSVQFGWMTRSLGAASQTAEQFLTLAESLVELTADSGCETEDTPYIEAVTQAAQAIAASLEDALRTGAISLDDLFDSNYAPIQGSNPRQFTTRFTAFADRLLPPFQERLLQTLPKVVTCAAVDRNGYLPTHNQKFSKPQGPDPVWNAANCRNRRIFDDRTGLAAARNERRFLLQTYRRDMGGGNYRLMKDLAAPIRVAGRHWGALRLAYEF